MSEISPPQESLRRPWFISILGVLVIAGLLALPWIDLGEADELADGFRFAGHFHPVLLHLPIGVFVLILLQEFGRMVTRREVGEKGIGFPLLFGVMSAVLAVMAGFLLWKSGADDYAGNDLAERHLWGGIAFAIVAVMTCLLKAWSQVLGWRPLSYRLPLFVAFCVMGFASHDGASMTHGSDYLTKYAPQSLRDLLGIEGERERSSADLLVYEDVIEPIFERRCVQCHKAGKSKGRLQMDSFEMLVKGGKEGPGIEPGNAEASNIVVRMMLPHDDEEHMPPKGKPQVEDDELMVVKWWINEGADSSSRLADVEVPAAVDTIIAGLLQIPAGDSDVDALAVHAGPLKRDPKLQGLVAKLSEQFPGAASFESQQSPYVTLSAVSLREKLGDEQFEAFAPLLPHLVSADLSATRIGDRSVALLADAPNLRLLRLSETAITDSALDSLQGLQRLESLNLFGTQVTDDGVMKLAALEGLKRLYLWQTGVTEEGVRKLQAKLPGCEIVMGVE